MGDRTERDTLKAAEGAARALGIQAQFVEARGPADIDNAFSEITSARADAVAVLVSGMLLGERKHLVDLAATNRLPVVYAAVHKSGHGTKRTWPDVRLESGMGRKADVHRPIGICGFTF